MRFDQRPDIAMTMIAPLVGAFFLVIYLGSYASCVRMPIAPICSVASQPDIERAHESCQISLGKTVRNRTHPRPR